MFQLLTVLYVLVTILYLVIRCKRFFTYWDTNGVPQYQFWRIWYRTVVDFVNENPLTDGMQRMYHDFENSRYVGTYEYLQPRLCLRDPELIKRITVKDFDHFIDHSSFIPLEDDPVTKHSLFILKGESWKFMRSTVSPVFTTSKMKILFRNVFDYSDDFLGYIAKDPSDVIKLEMKDAFSRLTNDLIVSAIFGLTVNSMKDRDNTFLKMANEISNFSSNRVKAKFVMLKIFPNLSKLLGITLIDKKVCTFYKNLIRENIQLRKSNQILRPDLINILMEAKTNGPKNGTENITEGFAAVDDSSANLKNGFKTKPLDLTDDLVTALVMNFYGAGYDSVSTQLGFMAYELALHPDVQKKLQEEIDVTRLKCDGDLSYKELLEMKYMDMVVTETLRKWPLGFFLERVCIKPYTIEPSNSNEKPVHLSKGSPISIPLFALMRDPKYFPDPECFDPERFSDENKSKINQYIYMPFGSGPRHCIGNRFALMQIKVVFYQLLSKFDLIAIDETAVPLQLERRYFQLAAKNGFWLGLRKRI